MGCSVIRMCGSSARSGAKRLIKGQQYTLLSQHENLSLDGKRSLALLLAGRRDASINNSAGASCQLYALGLDYFVTDP